MHWLIPANPKFYDVFAAFSQNETFWPMNAKLSPGDTVYIYLSAPYKQIGFVCTVQGVDYALDMVMDAVAPFIRGEMKGDATAKPFMKLKPERQIAIDPASALSLVNLRQNGLSEMMMGARKLSNNPNLFSYINRILA